MHTLKLQCTISDTGYHGHACQAAWTFCCILLRCGLPYEGKRLIVHVICIQLAN